VGCVKGASVDTVAHAIQGQIIISLSTQLKHLRDTSWGNLHGLGVKWGDLTYLSGLGVKWGNLSGLGVQWGDVSSFRDKPEFRPAVVGGERFHLLNTHGREQRAQGVVAHPAARAVSE